MRWMAWALAALLATNGLAMAAANAASTAKEAAVAKQKAQQLETKAAESGGKPEATPAQHITKPEAAAVDPHGQKPLDDPLTCLARTIYWEARGEDTTGMAAIASVVLNRVGKEGFPDTICGVVKQGQKSRACQFSWWCNGKPDTVQDDHDRYVLAVEVARKALNGQLPDPTKGALYFLQKGAPKPSWAAKYVRTARIGNHDFYKPRGGTAR